ncbi:MAG: tetratricopeptide repeat protein [Planctomycetota bacterium]|nr:tetratricopeptide repeat protein [Planctomycetota bacterium]
MRRLLCACALMLAAACSGPETRTASDRLTVDGVDAFSDGRPRAAVGRFSAAAEASAARDDRARLARDLHNRGLALLAAGQAAAAVADLGESLRLASEMRASADDRARTRLALAAAQVAAGQAAAAARVLAECEPAAPSLMARGLASRAALALREGRDELAAGLLAEARRQAGEDPWALSAVAVNHGHLLRRRGDPDAARRAYREAAALSRAVGDHAGLVAALEGEALACEAVGELAAAAEAWRRAAAVPHGGEAARARRLEAAARCGARAAR